MKTQAYFEDIQEHLLKELQKAKKSIIVAVAWFTDKEIYELLCQKAGEGLKIEIMLINEAINRESGLNFKLLKSKKGIVNFIGDSKDEDNIMHNNFCVIDDKTVITGSYNWSKRAQRNDENITVIKEDLELVGKFTEAFYSIKNKYVYGETTFVADNDFKVLKRLENIKNLVLLGDIEDIEFQTEKLRKIIHHLSGDKSLEEVNKCLKLIESESYSEAIKHIDSFIEKFKRIIIYEDAEIPILKLVLTAFEIQLTSLQDEKIEIEKTIRSFTIRHDKELGELVVSILKIKRDRLKAKSKNDESKKAEYEEAEKDYKEYKHDAEAAKKEHIIDLTKEQEKEIKSKYRRASKLCHPDLVVEELKDKAQRMFQRLVDAYEHNDLDTVSEILERLEKDNWFVPKSEIINQKALLKAQISELGMNLRELVVEIINIKNSDTYQTINRIKNWETYFKETRENLESQLRELEEENA